LFDAALVPAAFEFGVEPDFHNFQNRFGRNQSLAEAEHVGVVVLAGEAGTFDVPANGAADAFDFVGDDGLAVSRAAQDDAALTFTARTASAAGRMNRG